MQGDSIFYLIAVGCGLSTFGWIVTTWIRAGNGYPIRDTEWGGLVHKGADDETAERLKLLTSENAQLRAELGSLKDRLATVERIVTDSGYGLGQEIERLRSPAN